MVTKKCKIMWDGIKISAVIVVLLLLLLVAAEGFESTNNETVTAGNNTENQKNEGLILHIFYNIAQRSWYTVISIALLIIISLILYVYKCVIPCSKPTANYVRQMV